MENFIKINQLLQKVDFYKKRDDTDDFKEWIDRHSNEAIFQKFLDLYLNCDFSFIEVTFPLWPHTVVYQDLMYDEIKTDYIYSLHHIQQYQ